MSSEGGNNKNKNDIVFKMIVIGDPFVGKTCLTRRAVKDKFETDYKETLGFEFLSFTTNIDNKDIKLQIWDTCGQEIYRSLISSFYRQASLAMMVYSIDDRKSFININQWLKEIKLQSNPEIKIILIGNKSDLEAQREVNYEEAKKFKDENQLLYFEETSAKDGINTKEAFIEAAKILYEEYKRYKMRGGGDRLPGDTPNAPLPTNLNKVKQNRKSGCC